MNLPEYESIELFRRYGISYPKSEVTGSAGKAGVIARSLGCRKFVVKAQVAAGGRGKAGGVLYASSPGEVEEAALQLLSQGMIPDGTDTAGLPVRLVMVREYIDTQDQFYLSVTMLGGEDHPIGLFSLQGGVDIEELSVDCPQKIRKTRLDPFCGFRKYQMRRLLDGSGLEKSIRLRVSGVAEKMAALMLEEDALLAEINPLGLTKDGELYGLDAKIVLDDNAAFRHPKWHAKPAGETEDPLESAAQRSGISYVRLSGNIGFMVNGAGLAMEVMDMIDSGGGKAANFLDVGGGADKERIRRAFEILLSDDNVRTVLVNIFGGILRCDLVAEALVETLPGKELPWPMVVRLKGHGQDEAKKILIDSKLPILMEDDFHKAVKKTVSLSRY